MFSDVFSMLTSLKGSCFTIKMFSSAEMKTHKFSFRVTSCCKAYLINTPPLLPSFPVQPVQQAQLLFPKPTPASPKCWLTSETKQHIFPYESYKRGVGFYSDGSTTSNWWHEVSLSWVLYGLLIKLAALPPCISANCQAMMLMSLNINIRIYVKGEVWEFPFH